MRTIIVQSRVPSQVVSCDKKLNIGNIRISNDGVQ